MGIKAGGIFERMSKRMNAGMKSLAVFAVVLVAFVSGSRHPKASRDRLPGVAYLYVEVETKVYRKGVEISSENPEERRWYFSNVVVQPEDVPSYSLAKKKIMPYFSRNVMDPFEARGFSLDYGDEDVRICGETSRANYETRAEAETARNEEI